MIFKVAAGLAVGYVLGARAARERYEQISALARRARNRPEAPSPRTVGVADDLPLEAAEADVVEQGTPAVDHRAESVLAPMPLESNADDVLEQRRS